MVKHLNIRLLHMQFCLKQPNQRYWNCIFKVTNKTSTCVVINLILHCIWQQVIRISYMVSEKYKNIEIVRKSILQKSQSQYEENRKRIPNAIIFHNVIYKECTLSFYSRIIVLGLHQHFLCFQIRSPYLFILDESNECS